METRILVPLDGSDLAEQALPCATMLARGLPVELVLFHAVSLPSDVEDILAEVDLKVDAPLDQLEAEARSYLDRVASRLEEVGVRVQPVVQRGPVARAIVDYAEQMNMWQIVMATHGHSGITRWVHGSVVERVLQASSVPVLLVRADKKGLDDVRQEMVCRRILVPLDGSSVAEQVLPPVKRIAQTINAQIILFRVPIVIVHGSSLMGEWYIPLEGTFDTAEQNARAYMDRVAERLQAQGIRASVAMRAGGVADSIIDYAEANHIDLIAMCTHGRTSRMHWTLGSVADRVLRAGHIPILLVRVQ